MFSNEARLLAVSTSCCKCFIHHGLSMYHGGVADLALALSPAEGIPPLAHLCRLQLRASVGSPRLADRSYVQRLPLPSLLHDYVQFKDVFAKHCNPLCLLSVPL